MNSIVKLSDYYKSTPWVALLRAIEINKIHGLHEQCNPPILDLGCGDGFVAKLAFNHQLDIGIDIDRNALLIASKNEAYNGLSQVDSRYLPFKNNTFRTVYSNCAMEHMNDLDVVISEISRVLKSGGMLITLVPSDNLLNPVGFLGKIFGKRFWNKYNKLHNHVNLFSEEQWRSKLNYHGISIKNIQQYGGKAIAKYVLNWDFLSKFNLNFHWPLIGLRHNGNCIRFFSFFTLSEKKLQRLYIDEINQMQDGYWLMIYAKK